MKSNIHTREFDGPRCPTPVKAAPAVMVLLAATMIGTSSGVLIADRDALPLLKKSFASQLAAVRSCLLATPDTAGAKPATPDIIPTGLSSIVAIRYSSKPDSTHIAFDLQATNLVRTGKLRNPDRIYFDLKDHKRQQGTLKRPKTQKTVTMAGGLLTGVRISQRKPGATRIVLDLKCSCDFTYKASPGPPACLMVEIRPRPTGASASDAQRSAS